MIQTRSVRLSFTQSVDADGRGSPNTARSMTGTGMLLLRGLPLRVLGRQMRHGRKGCGRTDKETRRQQETTQAREARCVCLSVLGCVYASVYPSCSRWLLAISSKNDHCCRLYSYKWRVFFFGLGSCSFFFLYCTYVPRVCRVIPCPILLVRASYHTVFSCDNNSVFITPHSEQHQLFWWDV